MEHVESEAREAQSGRRVGAGARLSFRSARIGTRRLVPTRLFETPAMDFYSKHALTGFWKKVKFGLLILVVFDGLEHAIFFSNYFGVKFWFNDIFVALMF